MFVKKQTMKKGMSMVRWNSNWFNEENISFCKIISMGKNGLSHQEIGGVQDEKRLK